MALKGIEDTVQNQIYAFKEFQKTYNFELSFPTMDLDEYIKLTSNLGEEKNMIRKSRDYAKHSVDDIIKAPMKHKITQSTTYQVLKGIKEARGNSINFIGGYIPAPYTLASMVLELQVASELMIFEPEFLKTLITFSGEIIEQYAKLISQFVDTIFILAPSECTIMKQSYRKYVEESMNKLIQYCVSELNIPTMMHFCAKKNKNIVNEDIITPMKEAGIDGLNIPNIITNVGLAKKLDLILCGGIDPISIEVRTVEEILGELKQTLDDTKHIKYISATNCQITSENKKMLGLFSELKNIIRD